MKKNINNIILLSYLIHYFIHKTVQINDFYGKHLRINTLYLFNTIPKTQYNIKKKLNSILPIELPHRGESLHPTKLDIGEKSFCLSGALLHQIHLQFCCTDNLV